MDIAQAVLFFGEDMKYPAILNPISRVHLYQLGLKILKSKINHSDIDKTCYQILPQNSPQKRSSIFEKTFILTKDLKSLLQTIHGVKPGLTFKWPPHKLAFANGPKTSLWKKLEELTKKLKYPEIIENIQNEVDARSLRPDVNNVNEVTNDNNYVNNITLTENEGDYYFGEGIESTERLLNQPNAESHQPISNLSDDILMGIN